MKIFLSDQTRKFPRHLSDLKSTPVMSYEKRLLTEKTSSVFLDINFSEIDFDSFFNYEIFPGNILTFLTQWQAEGRQMQVGDTILQQVYLPPFPRLSQKIIFGVRICEIINTPEKKGFSYETLEGHVEKGISTFTIERKENTCIFKILTFSQPGNVLTKLLGPIFSVPYQTFCTKAALKNVKERMEGRKKRPFTTIVMFILIALLSHTPAKTFGQENTGFIKLCGQDKKTQTALVDTFTVTFDNSKAYKLKPDSEGCVSLKLVPIGKYNVTLAVPHYETKQLD